MSTDLDPRHTFCLTRQPILDVKGNVFGYELIYRTGDDTSEPIESGDLASARVLADAVLSLGIDTLTGGRPAFVNFTRNLLLSDAGTLLPPAAMVIALGGDVAIDSEVVDACEGLHNQGYAIGIDDFTVDRNAAALMPYVKFAMVDMSQTSVDDRASLASWLQPIGVQLIAKNVDTSEIAAEVRANGYRLFQGYYFCMPTTFGSAAMPERRLAYLNLLAALNREDLTVGELEELVKHDVSLSYRVLRLINSAAYSLRTEVTSIRQALVLLGRDQIRKWASVWALAGANSTGTQETVSVALMRARCCELLGTHLSGDEEGASFFLLGLCSLLDAIVGRPMAEALAELPLPPLIKDALLGESNQAREALDAVIAYEQGEWDDATSAVERLHLTVDLQDVYADALRWARELSRAAVT